MGEREAIGGVGMGGAGWDWDGWEWKEIRVKGRGREKRKGDTGNGCCQSPLVWALDLPA